MATPIVENEYGLFRYEVSIKRWLCLRGRIPGGSAGSGANQCVHFSYGQELSKAARSAGFTKEDFGAKPKSVKVEKAERTRRKKPSARKSKPAGEVLFDFSE